MYRVLYWKNILVVGIIVLLFVMYVVFVIAPTLPSSWVVHLFVSLLVGVGENE